jgi:hypothetical protein
MFGGAIAARRGRRGISWQSALVLSAGGSDTPARTRSSRQPTSRRGFLCDMLPDVLSCPRTLVVEIARRFFGLRRNALDKLTRLRMSAVAGSNPAETGPINPRH